MSERKLPKYVILERVSHSGLWIAHETNDFSTCQDHKPQYGKKTAVYVQVLS